jgi:hypothetical protein
VTPLPRPGTQGILLAELPVDTSQTTYSLFAIIAYFE